MNRQRVMLLVLGALTLLLGITTYVLFREPGSVLVLDVWPMEMLSRLFHVSTGVALFSWLPSLIFVFAMAVLTAGLREKGPKHYLAIPSLWFLVALVAEVAQGVESLVTPLRWGVLDPLDIVASCMGAVVASVTLRWFHFRYRETTIPPNSWQPRANLLLMVIAATCLVATGAPPEHFEYMSYEELREPITGDGPMELEFVGPIHAADGLLFVNLPNQGVHVYDVTNPTEPLDVAFVEIPGNLDIFYKGGFLYADSFIDMVVLDLTNPSEAVEVARVLDVFPYDPNQTLDQWSSGSQGDEEKGVVIGYWNEKVFGCNAGEKGSVYTFGLGKGGEVFRFATRGDSLWACGEGSLAIFDITSPGSPVLTDETEIVAGASRVELGSDLMIVNTRDSELGDDEGIVIYDAADPDTIVQTSVLDGFSGTDRVAVGFGHLYIATYQHLKVFDIQIPEVPVLVGDLSVDQATSLSLDGDLLFVCKGGHGVEVFSVIEPGAPMLLSKTEEAACSDLIAREEILYVTNEWQGVALYNYESFPMTLLSRIDVDD